MDYVDNQTVCLTIDEFLLSAKALSFEWRERDLVNSIWSLSNSYKHAY